MLLVGRVKVEVVVSRVWWCRFGVMVVFLGVCLFRKKVFVWWGWIGVVEWV